MVVLTHPALEKFVAQVGEELVLAQVLILRRADGFELRHVRDRTAPAEKLRALRIAELRPLAQFTALGAFRPLKSAPNLQSGWRVVVASSLELETALNQLYPGALADWFAAQAESPPVTHFREFTHRQTGMYRITQMLDDVQAGQVIRAGCHKSFCLKRRLWSVTGLDPDSPSEKTLVPCLEPCAVLLEFARKAMRIEQAEKLKVDVSVEDAATLGAALQGILDQPGPAVREADFSAPVNPRRVQLVLEKWRSGLRSGSRSEDEGESC